MLKLQGFIDTITKFLSNPATKSPNLFWEFWGKGITCAYDHFVHINHLLPAMVLSRLLGKLSHHSAACKDLPGEHFSPIKMPNPSSL